jgi:hypothetical protein
MSYHPAIDGWFRRTVLTGCVLAVALGGLAIAPTPLCAQAEDAARAASARSLFEEGVALADQGHWQEAADRFRRALALRDSAVIAYNLASALQEIGQLIEASELLRKVRADQAADEELRKSASTALAAIEPRIARLSVQVRGQQTGDRVRLDARELLPAELDVALPIDPGAHTLRVERGEQTMAERALTIAEGQSQTVVLEIAAPAPTPREVAVAAPPVTPREPAHTSEAEPPLTGRWYFWAGVGAAAVGIGVVVAVLASSGGGDAPEPAAGDFEPGVVGVRVGR